MSERGGRAGGIAPLKGTHLAAGAWRAIQANGRALLPIGLAYAVFSVAAEAIAGGARGLDPQAGPAFLVYATVSGIFGALLGAFAIRRLLAPEGGVFRVNGGLLAYVAIVAAMGLAMNVLALQVAGQPPEPTDPAAAGPYLGRAFGLLIGFGLALWIWLRLTLWPIGLLVGDRQVTPAVSFRLMRRAVFAVILGSAILGIGPMFVYGVIIASGAGEGPAPLWRLAIGAPFLAFFAIATSAVQAEAYRQRVLAGGVADAFD